MAIPIARQWIVLQRSGNVCAFPDCRVQLTAAGSPESPVVVFGEMANIVTESPNGLRGDSPHSAADRNLYQNLILLYALCGIPHKRQRQG